MSENQLEVNYRIFLESEDISQSRIQSTKSCVQNLLNQSTNPYLKQMEIDDESDMDDFVLRLYIEEDMKEAVCSDPQSATMIAPQLAEILSEIAQLQSYLDMEGSFSVTFQGETESYEFSSESGNAFCDFVKK